MTNGIHQDVVGRHREGFLTTKDVCKIQQISPFTLRSWRRGWYTDSNGKHYFFKDKTHLEFHWCKKHRRYEYDPIKIGLWTFKLKHKKHNSAVEAGKIKKKK